MTLSCCHDDTLDVENNQRDAYHLALMCVMGRLSQWYVVAIANWPLDATNWEYNLEVKEKMETYVDKSCYVVYDSRYFFE